ncbi:MAG: ribonuclease PH [Propionibacteriaceae bacterium]|jgi:hypothetical protein|nr:ribonuclease PH [Propionibacteriaceae bacterium]
MKRKAVIDRLREEARRRGFVFETEELTNHTAFYVGGHRSTLKRHTEIDEITAKAFWDQFASVFGKGWWRS